MWSEVHTRHLLAHGYVRLPGVVDAGRVAEVNAAIDADRAARYDPARQTEYDHRSACPDLRDQPVIARLAAEGAGRRVIDAVLGWERVRVDDGQIAIREARQVAQPEAPQPHIDGIPTPHNGVRGVFLHTFTALLGVFLTDTPGPDAGNFTVWPGSHRALATWVRQRGPAAMATTSLPDAPLGEPVQLVTSPGDLVLCTYALAHAATANASAEERRAVFFRIHLRDLWRPDLRWRRLVDPFDGWRL